MINKISYLEPKGQPKQLVMFLHGLGSNKDDLISLSEEFKEILPEALFISPNAPHKCDFAPGGYQWFSLDDRDNARIEKEIDASVLELNDFIDKMLIEYDVAADNLYLIGFSQGATMAVHSAVKREVPVKAILAYSGLIFDNLDVLSKPKIIGLAHGKLDDVVPFSWHEENIRKMKKYNFNHKELVMEGVYHEIPCEAVEFGKEILNEKS